MSLSSPDEIFSRAQNALNVEYTLLNQVISFFHRDRIACINEIIPILQTDAACHTYRSVCFESKACVENRQRSFPPKKARALLGVLPIRKRAIDAGHNA